MTAEALRTRFEILLNDDDIVPITDRPTVYVEGIDPELAGRYGNLVSAPAQAQVALIRLKARADRDASAQLAHLTDVAETTTTVVDIDLDRPARLSPLVGPVKTVLVSAGESDEAFLNLVFGRPDQPAREPRAVRDR